jgi:anti-anti-sigma factor
MAIQIEQQENLIRVTPQGDMTIYQAGEMKPELLKALGMGSDLELHLSEVTEIDTAGFQLLILIKREASRLGKSVRMVAHSPATLEVMDAYRMASYFGDPLIITQ